MKNILESSFFKKMKDIIYGMYHHGWDERNGGNVSLLVTDEELEGYIDKNVVIRTIPFDFCAEKLAGKYFLVTSSGKYFRNVVCSPETTLGLIRIAKDGHHAELLWGFEDGGVFTSEFPSHMKCHMQRLEVDPENRVIMHCHPTNILAMNYVHELDEISITRDMWKTGTECIVVFPEGIGVLPWMLCGTNEIGDATSEKMKEYRLVIWGMHGIYACGKNLDEAFGLIETLEKAAEIYMLTSTQKRINTITDDQLRLLANFFKVNYKKGVID